MSESEKSEMIRLHKSLFIVFGLLFFYDFYYSTTSNIVRVSDPKFSLLGPYNSTDTPIDDVYDQLIDIKDFSFKSNPKPCSKYSAGLLLLIIVASNPNNTQHRTIIRNTWGRSVDSTKVLFLIGESEIPDVTQQIQNESVIHGDIIQGTFIDAYRNMTYKHVMGLKWVSHYCSNAKYVLKTDDDVVVNSHALRQFLARELSPWGAKGLITCQVLEHAQVQRSPRSKWKVSVTEYAPHYYPTYCAGWAILYSQDVVRRLLKVSQEAPYFWIDDVHITGVMAQQIGVPRTPLSGLILNRRRAKMLTTLGPSYVGPFIFGPPDLSTHKISEIWKAIPE